MNHVDGLLADSPTPILLKIAGESTIEALIELHRLISSNTASVASNLGGGQHGLLALAMTTEDYMSQTGHTFVLPYIPDNHPPTLGTSQ